MFFSQSKWVWTVIFKKKLSFANIAGENEEYMTLQAHRNQQIPNQTGWRMACERCESASVSTNMYRNTHVYVCIVLYYTSSTAQGGGGSFKNRKPTGEAVCCEWGMAERSHWWSERWLISLTISLSLSLTIYLPTYLPNLSIYLPIYLSLSLFHLFTYLSIYPSIYLSIHPSISLSFICLAVYLSICGAVSLSVM